LPVGEAELARTTLDQSSGAEFHHQIPHGKPFANIFLGVEFTTRVQGNGTFGHDPGRQGNVGGDRQIIRCDLFGNVIIGHIKAIIDDN
jgi:hypothetical protein